MKSSSFEVGFPNSFFYEKCINHSQGVVRSPWHKNTKKCHLLSIAMYIAKF